MAAPRDRLLHHPQDRVGLVARRVEDQHRVRAFEHALDGRDLLLAAPGFEDARERLRLLDPVAREREELAAESPVHQEILALRMLAGPARQAVDRVRPLARAPLGA